MKQHHSWSNICKNDRLMLQPWIDGNVLFVRLSVCDRSIDLVRAGQDRTGLVITGKTAVNETHQRYIRQMIMSIVIILIIIHSHRGRNCGEGKSFIDKMIDNENPLNNKNYLAHSAVREPQRHSR
jgi:hypothetical protein